MSRPDRETRRRAYRRRCMAMSRRSRLAAAALIAASAATAQQANAAFAGPEWTLGGGTGTYDLIYGDVNIDIDGDSITDLNFIGSCIGCGYGEAVYISPAQVGDYNNQVFTLYGSIVQRFDTADDIYLANASGMPDTSIYQSVLWDSYVGLLDFELRGFAGIKFDVPGGSEYLGYVDMTIESIDGNFSQLVIHETGYLSLGGSLLGDLDGDGFVGLADLDIVLGHWNQNVTPGDLLAGDPSGDGYVGLDDLDVVLGNWNAGGIPGSVTPEPASALLLGACGILLIRRRVPRA